MQQHYREITNNLKVALIHGDSGVNRSTDGRGTFLPELSVVTGDNHRATHGLYKLKHTGTNQADNS